METYTKILTDSRLPDTFSGLLVLSLDDNDLVIYCNCGRNTNYLKIKIIDVVAYQVHEEFCHPDRDKGKDDVRPPYSNEAKKIYYPALEIKNSLWLKSFSGNRLRHRKDDAKHYQFLSYSNILDVISNSECTASLIAQDEYYDAEGFVKNSIA